MEQESEREKKHGASLSRQVDNQEPFWYDPGHAVN